MSEECKLGHLTNIPILLTINVSTIWYDQKSHSSGVKYQFALALRRVRVCLLYLYVLKVTLLTLVHFLSLFLWIC